MQAEPTEQAIPSRSSDIATDDAVGVAGDDRERARAGAPSGWPVGSTPGDREDRRRGVGRAARAAGRRSRPAPYRTARRRSPGRRPRPRSPCRPGGGAPGCRPAAGRGCASRGGRRARRRPWGPRTCGPRARRGPRPAPRRRGRRTAPPGRHRRGSTTPLRVRTRAAISAIGWIVPTSLLASMIETRIVLSLRAASSWSGSTRP